MQKWYFLQEEFVYFSVIINAYHLPQEIDLLLDK